MSTPPDDQRPGSPVEHPGHTGEPGMAVRAGDAAKLWLRRIIGAVAVIAILVVVYFALAAVVPRWWAGQLGRIIGGSMTKGTGVGLLIGGVCTAIPLLLLYLAARKIRSSPAVAAVSAVLAIIIAIPNLLTLSIVLGNGNASHAGERILDVDGPMFRGASAVGAALGALLVVLFIVWNLGRGKRKAQKMADKAAAKQAKLEAKAAAKAEKADRRGSSGEA